ncbi:MAG: hypothetical protein EA350_08640 [Gemmatimonadales bacterium]|nr:MAG: hypothetical protein EA350_08640 [Gemmatimonadales bacterium]
MRRDHDGNTFNYLLWAGVLAGASAALLLTARRLGPARLDVDRPETFRTRASFTIRRNPDAVFDGWRAFDHPGLLREVDWETDITEERRPDLLRWATSPGVEVPHRGEFTSRPWRDGDATHVDLLLQVGEPGVPLPRSAVEEEIGKGLRRFKARMEAGDVASSDQGRGGEPGSG